MKVTVIYCYKRGGGLDNIQCWKLNVDLAAVRNTIDANIVLAPSSADKIPFTIVQLKNESNSEHREQKCCCSEFKAQEQLLFPDSREHTKTINKFTIYIYITIFHDIKYNIINVTSTTYILGSNSNINRTINVYDKNAHKILAINCYPFGGVVENEEDRVGGRGARRNETGLGVEPGIIRVRE